MKNLRDMSDAELHAADEEDAFRRAQSAEQRYLLKRGLVPDGMSTDALVTYLVNRVAQLEDKVSVLWVERNR